MKERVMGGTYGVDMVWIVCFVDCKGFDVVKVRKGLIATWKNAGLAVSGEDEMLDRFGNVAGGSTWL